MNLKNLLISYLMMCSLALVGGLAVADGHGGPTAQGASISFANLADGDVVPPGFTVRFAVSGMDVAPAGTQGDNSGHFHLLIDLDELPPLDRALPATEQIVHFGKGQTETTLDLPEGPHRLQLLMGDYAHVPHDPPVLSEVISIVVSADAR